MYKKLLMGLALIAGSVYATPSESMKINVGGVVINTDDNTLGIGKNERLLLVTAGTMDPALRALIKACDGKPTDLILWISGNEVKIVTDFTSTKLKSQAPPKKFFKHCFGSIMHDDGTYEYFCKGPQCETLGYVINTERNAVGIADGDICYLHPDKKTIQCVSGIVIKNPIQRESSLTGTPGFLSGAGYIGYIVSKPSTPSLMGSGKKIHFYRR